MEDTKYPLSKGKIERRMRQKKDINLVQTIIKLKKSNPEVAKELARPKRRWPSVNLKEIDVIDGDILVAGKVLSAGDLSNSKKIVAWAISEKALEKVKDAKGNFVTITEEMKKNPQLNGLSILR